jgi:hypothetical protein
MATGAGNGHCLAMSGKRGTSSGTILTLAILVGLLLLAIVFMAIGWDAPEGGTPMSTAGWIAMVLGIVATLALGAGLMALMFYSSRHGRD